MNKMKGLLESINSIYEQSSVTSIKKNGSGPNADIEVTKDGETIKYDSKETMDLVNDNDDNHKQGSFGESAGEEIDENPAFDMVQAPIDWLGRKMKIKTTKHRPNEKDAPAWAKFMGQTVAGAWYWLSNKTPIVGNGDSYFPNAEKTEFSGFVSNPNGWRHSLLPINNKIREGFGDYDDFDDTVYDDLDYEDKTDYSSNDYDTEDSSTMDDPDYDTEYSPDEDSELNFESEEHDDDIDVTMYDDPDYDDGTTYNLDDDDIGMDFNFESEEHDVINTPAYTPFNASEHAIRLRSGTPIVFSDDIGGGHGIFIEKSPSGFFGTAERNGKVIKIHLGDIVAADLVNENIYESFEKQFNTLMESEEIEIQDIPKTVTIQAEVPVDQLSQILSLSGLGNQEEVYKPYNQEEIEIHEPEMADMISAVDEAWDTETETPKSKQGMFKGKTQAELKSMLSDLKKSGPHKKGSPEYKKQNEIEFALRAKHNWGKVNEDEGQSTTNDYQEWRLPNGNLHRVDGPAIIDGDRKEWYINGKRHREDGPAIINGDYKSWYINGKLHREDGPAHIEGDHKEYWLNGKQVNKSDLSRTVTNEGNEDEDQSTMSIENGAKVWRGSDGWLHRKDGPAVIDGNIQEYWLNGNLDREDGPAIIDPDNDTVIWYKNGEKHREDGPAQINGNVQMWYKNGLRDREDGPAVVDPDGNYQAWYRNNKKHREDGPAVIDNNIKEWYKNGLRHREDGPAIINSKNGHKEYWLNGIKVDKSDLPNASGVTEEYSNEPDEEIASSDVQLNAMAGGLNRPKRQFKKEYPGDNPMTNENNIFLDLYKKIDF